MLPLTPVISPDLERSASPPLCAGWLPFAGPFARRPDGVFWEAGFMGPAPFRSHGRWLTWPPHGVAGPFAHQAVSDGGSDDGSIRASRGAGRRAGLATRDRDFVGV